MLFIRMVDQALQLLKKKIIHCHWLFGVPGVPKIQFSNILQFFILSVFSKETMPTVHLHAVFFTCCFLFQVIIQW
jgi:hypothetical protein